MGLHKGYQGTEGWVMSKRGSGGGGAIAREERMPRVEVGWGLELGVRFWTHSWVPADRGGRDSGFMSWQRARQEERVPRVS